MSAKLDTNLHKWAVDLTQRHRVFSHDQLLTPQNFSDLTRDERLQPILTFLIRHVRPPEEQRQIKLNLKHAQLRKKLAGAECEVSTSEERFRLKAAIIDTRSTVSSEVTEIQQLSQRKEEFHQREVELRRRTTLLKVVEEEREREVQHCNSWNSQLATLIDNVPVSTEKRNNPTVIDPSVQRLLRSNLLNIETLRHSINNGRLVSQDCIHEEKLRLWGDVGETLEDWGPRALLIGLLGEVREGTRNLQSLIQRVDLSRDAHELRLKCEKDGSFIDEMNPGGVIESVRELLGQMSAAHVKLFMEAHRADQVAASLSRVLNTLKNNISAAAKRTYDDNVAASVINLVQENISVVGERAALNTTHTLTSSLQERANTAARARDALRSKYAKIASFNKEVKFGVEGIHCLAVSVKEGLESIRSHLEMMKTDISDVLEATTYPTPVSINALSRECESFTSVPLAYFLTTDVDEYGIQRKVNMTTSSLVWYDKTLVDAGWSAVATLNSGQLCWDGVYNCIVDRVNHTTSLHNQMDQLRNLRPAVSSSQKKTKMLLRQEVKDLTEEAEKNDKKLEEEVGKLTVSFEKQISEGTQHLHRVSRLLSEWWEQPAKKVTITKVD